MPLSKNQGKGARRVHQQCPVLECVRERTIAQTIGQVKKNAVYLTSFLRYKEKKKKAIVTALQLAVQTEESVQQIESEIHRVIIVVIVFFFFLKKKKRKGEMELKKLHFRYYKNTSESQLESTAVSHGCTMKANGPHSHRFSLAESR